MNYITTNIRISEEDYLRLKAEAADKRKSLSAIVRERIAGKQTKQKTPQQIMSEIRKHAKENAKYLKNWDSLKALREIRDEN